MRKCFSKLRREKKAKVKEKVWKESEYRRNGKEEVNRNAI